MEYRIGDSIIIKEVFNESSENDYIKIDSSNFKDNEIKYYQNNLQGKYINHPTLGKIHLGKKGRHETKFKSPKKYLSVICFIDKIIETGYCDNKLEELKHLRNDSIKGFYKIYNKILYDGKLLNVIILIASDMYDQKYYMFKIYKNENLMLHLDETPEEAIQLHQIYNNIINQKLKNVNPFKVNNVNNVNGGLMNNLEEHIKNAINRCIEKGESNHGAIMFEDITSKDTELLDMPWDKLQKEIKTLGYPIIEFQGFDFVSSRKMDRDSFEELLWKYEDELFPGTIHENESLDKNGKEWKDVTQALADYLKDKKSVSAKKLSKLYSGKITPATIMAVARQEDNYRIFSDAQSGDAIISKNESLNESFEDMYKEGMNLVSEGENKVCCMDTEFSEKFMKRFDQLCTIKSKRAKFKRIKDMLFDISFYLIDEIYDEYCERIDDFLKRCKNESLNESSRSFPKTIKYNSPLEFKKAIAEFRNNSKYKVEDIFEGKDLLHLVYDVSHGNMEHVCTFNNRTLEKYCKSLNELKIDTIRNSRDISQSRIVDIERQIKDLKDKKSKEVKRLNKFDQTLKNRKEDGYYVEVFNEFDMAPLSPWIKKFNNKNDALNLFDSLNTEEEWVDYVNDNDPDFLVDRVMAVAYYKIYNKKLVEKEIKFFDNWFKNHWEKEWGWDKNKSLNEDFEKGKMLKNIKDINNIYFNPNLDEDETREALEIYQSEHNLTSGDIARVIGEDSYNRLYSDYDEDEYDDEYEDFDESLNEAAMTWKKSPTQEQFYDFLEEVSDQSHINMRYMNIEDDDMPMEVDFDYNDRHIKMEFISEHLDADKYIIVYVDKSHVEVFRYEPTNHEQLVNTVKRIFTYIDKN